MSLLATAGSLIMCQYSSTNCNLLHPMHNVLSDGALDISCSMRVATARNTLLSNGSGPLFRN